MSDTLLHVLLALATIMVAGRALGMAAGWAGQPPVMGEIVAGILLGPSLLGRVAPGTMDFLFPASVASHLGILAQLGVILFMFLVGLELNTEMLRARARAATTVAQASIAVPLLFGAVLAWWLYPTQAPEGVSFPRFASFVGVALAVTAFPVLARILTDRGLARTELGVIALSAAAIGDVAAWCLLAVVIGVVQERLAGALATATLAVGYIAVVLLLVRPAAKRLFGARQGSDVSPALFAIVLITVLLSAAATEAIGVHALFGAFLIGVIIPHDSAGAVALHDKLHDIVVILLLPAFFAYTGLRTEIGLLAGLDDWLMCGAIIGVATAGKVLGAYAAARWTGLTHDDAASLGVLMNTRGLVELIVLNVGLDLGIIQPRLFAMLVVMALVTTLATTPLLLLIRKRSSTPDGESPVGAGAASEVCN